MLKKGKTSSKIKYALINLLSFQTQKNVLVHAITCAMFKRRCTKSRFKFCTNCFSSSLAIIISIVIAIIIIISPSSPSYLNCLHQTQDLVSFHQTSCQEALSMCRKFGKFILSITFKQLQNTRKLSNMIITGLL